MHPISPVSYLPPSMSTSKKQDKMIKTTTKPPKQKTTKGLLVQNNILQPEAMQSFKKSLQPQNVIQEEEISHTSSSCISKDRQRQSAQILELSDEHSSDGLPSFFESPFSVKRNIEPPSNQVAQTNSNQEPQEDDFKGKG